MKSMSEALLINAVAAILKNDKLEVQSAEFSEEGDAIRFVAKSKSGQVRINGLFCDPQGQLDLEPPAGNIEGEPVAGEEPAANEDEEDDEQPH